MWKWAGIIGLCGLAIAGVGAAAISLWISPGVVRELREDPQGERAGKVMVITLPSGRTFPVNYLREGSTVYAGADFPWWREVRGPGGRGSVMIRGETYPAHLRAVEDDPALRERVFAKLRPNAIKWAGVLVVIEID